MRGPYERLKYEFRRTFECPVCHQQRRLSGTHTCHLCSCQAQAPLEEVRWMKMIAEGDSLPRQPDSPLPETIKLAVVDHSDSEQSNTAAQETDSPNTSVDTATSDAATSDTATSDTATSSGGQEQTAETPAKTQPAEPQPDESQPDESQPDESQRAGPKPAPSDDANGSAE